MTYAGPAETGRRFVEALSLPRGTTRAVLTLTASDMPTLDVTHYLSMEQADDLIEVVKRFRLEPLDDEPVAEVDPVDAARRRVHALVDEMAARAHRHVKRAATEARLRLRGWMK